MIFCPTPCYIFFFTASHSQKPGTCLFFKSSFPFPSCLSLANPPPPPLPFFMMFLDLSFLLWWVNWHPSSRLKPRLLTSRAPAIKWTYWCLGTQPANSSCVLDTSTNATPSQDLSPVPGLALPPKADLSTLISWTWLAGFCWLKLSSQTWPQPSKACLPKPAAMPTWWSFCESSNKPWWWQLLGPASDPVSAQGLPTNEIWCTACASVGISETQPFSNLVLHKAQAATA